MKVNYPTAKDDWDFSYLVNICEVEASPPLGVGTMSDLNTSCNSYRFKIDLFFYNKLIIL